MGVLLPQKKTLKDGRALLLRSAYEQDAKLVLNLSYNVISENQTLITTAEEFNFTEEQQKELIFMYRNDPGNLMMIAEFNNTLIGLLTFQRGVFQKYAHNGSIGMIVHKDYRNKGVGRALLSTFIDWGYQNPLIEKLCLEVLASNKGAITLYKQLGFEEEGRQLKQVKLGNGHYDDLITMGHFLD